jgi:hypothetical protein
MEMGYPLLPAWGELTAAIEAAAEAKLHLLHDGVVL